MKTAVIPQVRVEPELRSELEAVLQSGETLSGFVEASVRRAVEYRQMQSRFLARGQAAWAQVQAGGATVSADAVLTKLEHKLQARRKQLADNRGG